MIHKKFILVLIIINCTKNINAQLSEYDRLFHKTSLAINSELFLDVGDTVPTANLEKRKNINNDTKGVMYPNINLPFINSDTSYLYSIIADEVILNFNYYYCDECVKKLDELY